MRFLLYGALSAILLAACGDPIDDHIDNLMEGGEAREQAFMDLLFARSYAVPPLLSALADADLDAIGEADFDALLQRHVADYRSLYDRVVIDLGRSRFDLQPLDCLRFEAIAEQINKINFNSPNIQEDFDILRIEHVGRKGPRPKAGYW